VFPLHRAPFIHFIVVTTGLNRRRSRIRLADLHTAVRAAVTLRLEEFGVPEIELLVAGRPRAPVNASCHVCSPFNSRLGRRPPSVPSARVMKHNRVKVQKRDSGLKIGLLAPRNSFNSHYVQNNLEPSRGVSAEGRTPGKRGQVRALGNADMLIVCLCECETRCRQHDIPLDPGAPEGRR